MTTDLQPALAAQMTPERIDRGLELLRHSLPSLHGSSENADMARRAIVALTIPADSTWIAARVAALLDPYFEKDTPQAIREMIAGDWVAELDSSPQWAIERAVRWWKSSSNPDRRKKPLEGDISARCRVEMQAVAAAQIRLRCVTDAQQTESSTKQDRVSADDAQAIIDKYGFGGARRFGDA